MKKFGSHIYKRKAEFFFYMITRWNFNIRSKWTWKKFLAYDVEKKRSIKDWEEENMYCCCYYLFTTTECEWERPAFQGLFGLKKKRSQLEKQAIQAFNWVSKNSIYRRMNYLNTVHFFLRDSFRCFRAYCKLFTF